MRVQGCDQAESLGIDEAKPRSPFAALAQKSAFAGIARAAGPEGASVAVFDGFDLLDRPTVTGIPGLAGEIVAARSAVDLNAGMRGAAVVIVFEGGDARRPIILGILDAGRRGLSEAPRESTQPAIAAAGRSVLIEAERDLVLRCGDASITLTRGGRVLIEGHYILSRSTGYNKIKGAAIDIN